MLRCLGAAFLVFALSSTLFPHRIHTHPAHAEPVNYPFVVGFERFYSGLDSDEYLARGGLLLLNELNCVACHQPPAVLRDRLDGAEATLLRGVGDRLAPVDLEMMVRNPRFLKRDTTMPSLFAGPDRDPEEIEALVHFLAAQREPPPGGDGSGGKAVETSEERPQGDIDRGRRLYHRIGCVACHAPEVGYRPEELPESTPVELTGLPSVPLNLADRYRPEALYRFLLRPREHRPSGRMPDFSLAPSEAADLAAYLQAGPAELSDDLAEALAENSATGASAGTESGQNPAAPPEPALAERLVPDPALVARGRELFSSKSCIACHRTPEGDPADRKKSARHAPSAPKLAQLPPDSADACLSERPAAGGVPFYGLDEVQKKAIAEALRRLGKSQRASTEERLDWRLSALNCYACHDRKGKGGPETAREIYFAPNDPEALALGRWGSMPPGLDRVGQKLSDRWWNRLLLGEDPHQPRVARPYLETRMPLYRREDVEALPEWFRAVDGEEKEKPAQHDQFPKANQQPPLTAEEKRNCRECHPVAGEASRGLPGIDLGLAPERLEKDYFLQLLRTPAKLQPGTPMPPLEDPARAGVFWRWLAGE